MLADFFLQNSTIAAKSEQILVQSISFSVLFKLAFIKNKIAKKI